MVDLAVVWCSGFVGLMAAYIYGEILWTTTLCRTANLKGIKRLQYVGGTTLQLSRQLFSMRILIKTTSGLQSP